MRSLLLAGGWQTFTVGAAAVTQPCFGNGERGGDSAVYGERETKSQLKQTPERRLKRLVEEVNGQAPVTGHGLAWPV